jgi:hypothetical protein
MRAFGALSLFALTVAAAVAAPALNAEAHHRYGNCCGPIAPTRTYGVVNRISHETHYSDVYRKNYVHIPHVFEHITEVHPIVYIHNVLRVHHQTVPVIYSVYKSETTTLPTSTYVSNSVVNINEGCVCCSK